MHLFMLLIFLLVGSVYAGIDTDRLESPSITKSGYEVSTENWVEDRKIEVNSGMFISPTITITGNTAYVVGGEACLFSNSTWLGWLTRYQMPSTNFTIPSNTYTYIVANYNGGSPRYETTTSAATINNSDVAAVAHVFINDNGVTNKSHVFNAGVFARATATRISNRLISTDTFRYNSGLGIAAGSGLQFTIGSGFVWYDASSLSISAFDSATTNLVRYRTNASSNWTWTLSTSVDNFSYDTGGGTNTLNNNDYGVSWIYRCADGEAQAIEVLGNQSYDTLAEARAADLRSDLPTELRRMAFLVGQVITQEGNPNIVEVNSAFVPQTWEAAVTTSHNDLGGLNVGDYIHLTAAEYANLTTIGASTVIAITTNNYTLGLTNGTLFVNGAIPLTVTLPPASNAVGKIFRVKNIGTNIVDIYRAGDLIDGVTNYYTLGQIYKAVELQSAGSTNWYVVGGF